MRERRAASVNALINKQFYYAHFARLGIGWVSGKLKTLIAQSSCPSRNELEQKSSKNATHNDALNTVFPLHPSLRPNFFCTGSMIAEHCPNLDFWMRVNNDTTSASYTYYLDIFFNVVDADKAPYPWLFKVIILYLFTGMFSFRV